MKQIPERISVLMVVKAACPDLERDCAVLAAAVAKLGPDFELLLLVSTRDAETRAALEGLLASAPCPLRVLRFASRVGEAAMLGAGAENAHGDLLITLPGRPETHLEVIAELYAAIADGADLAVATRRRRDGPDAARRQSELFNRLISWAAGTRFRDIASSTRAVRSEVLREVPLYGDFHRYLPVLAERAGYRVEEVTATQHPGSRPRAVHSPLLYLWRAMDVLAVLFISRFTRSPLRLFGGIGAVSSLVGVALLAVLGAQRLAGVPLAGRPVLVLATLLVGLGVQAFAIGLLGELILFFHARRTRDYRVAGVWETRSAALPELPPAQRPQEPAP